MESIYTSGNPLPLFDEGALAKETRKHAHDEAKPKQAARTLEAIEAIKNAGRHGLTRHELAAVKNWPLSGTCPVALSAITTGKIIERGKRLSPYGKPAAVMIHVDHVRGGNDE